MPIISTEQTTLIDGPAGALELHAALPMGNARMATAIICHPHPLYGGTMNNKVVTTLAQSFQRLGLNAVRFNFRSIGKSAGEYAGGKGEVDDLMAVIAWVKMHFPNTDIWLSGFSFGSYIATCAASIINPAQLICVAPPVVNFNFSEIAPITCPWLIIQGDVDEVVPPTKVYSWIETLQPTPTLVRIPAAGHFFHGKLLDLRAAIENHFQ